MFIKGQTVWCQGKHLSEEHRRKLSIANIGIKRSEEFKKGISIRQTGRHYSEDTKKKMCKSRAGRGMSAETRNKIRATLLGCKISELPPKRNVNLKNTGIGKGRTNKGQIPWNKGKTYSMDPKKILRGYKNHNWKGGVSINTRQWLMREVDYKNWRMDVYLRDNFSCQICEQVGIRLNAHHIHPWIKYPELRYNLENGITLCQKCHNEVHKKEISIVEFIRSLES